MNNTPYNDEHVWAEKMLPWYINNTLTANERQRVEAHLVLCEQCQIELHSDTEVSKLLRATSKTNFAPNAALAKLNARIDADLERNERRSRVKAWCYQSFIDPWRQHSSAVRYRLGFGLIALQTFAIVSLSLGLWRISLKDHSTELPTQGYQTLSSSSQLPGATQNQRFQVVFSASATLSQLTELLTQLNAQIVRGPSRAGLIEIEFLSAPSAPIQAPEQQLATLRASKLVEFAALIPLGEGR